MDYFYDGQIRRYVTQFMRIFIGFQYKTGEELKHVPVMYGDMSRQVANIIRENSENKLPTVPRIACYITGLSLDTTRLADSTFVSKINIRERRYTNEAGVIEYQGVQGAGYTVERLMPTPFKLSMKADIWTTSTDQKLQLLEQILVLFNPSLEIQTTDNYIDWTSLSVVDVKNINPSSKTIPQGVESEIDIASIEFEMPIWVTPPAKVKKLGIVQSVIANVFTDSGDVVNLETLIYNKERGNAVVTTNDYRVLLFKSQNGEPYDFDLTLVDKTQAIQSLGLDAKEFKTGKELDWYTVLDIKGGYRPGQQIYFVQPNGFEMIGTFAVNPVDPSILVVTFDQDTVPTNTEIISAISGIPSRGTIDAIVDPLKYNPVISFGGVENIPLGHRLLILEDIGAEINQDGADAWAEYQSGLPRVDEYKISELIASANSIIEWNGQKWNIIFDPTTATVPTYIQNLKTKIQYRWDGDQWLKSFEGEYAPSYWGFIGDPC